MTAQTATPAQSPAGPQASSSSSKRCSMACTTCRQVKLRCDAAQRYPSPCSRCEKRRKTCVFDSEFKRRPVRGALERLLEEKEQLKQIVDSMNGGQANAATATTAASTAHLTPSHSHSQSVASPTVSAPVDDTPGYDLDGVRLSFAVVDDLFEFYISVFLPMLPILDIENKSPAAVCADSELLFWTILITAAQNHPQHRTAVFGPLVTPYRRLLADALVRPARTIYMTQALLIVTAWPLSVEMQRNDPSWYYCGFAASSAIHLRLHEAEALWWYSSAGGREEVVAEGGDGNGEDSNRRKADAARYRTWLGAFVVSNTLATDMGLPSPMGAVASLAPTLQKQLGEDGVPRDFAMRIELQTILFKSDTILKDAATTLSTFSSRGSLLDVLERELDAFEQKWTASDRNGPKELALMIRLDVLGARLRLRAPLLMPRPGPGSIEGTNSGEPDIFVEAAWQKTVYYAGQIVQLMADYLLGGTGVNNTATANRSTRPRPDLSAEKRCLPKHYYRVLLVAIFALLIYVMLHQKKNGKATDAPDEVFSRARAYTRQAPDLIQALARHPADENGRCARFIGLVAHYVDDPSLADEFADDFARALAPPVSDIIEVGIKASWVIRQRVRQKYLEGPDRDLPRRQPAATTPSATAARRTIVTRSSVVGRFMTDDVPVNPDQTTQQAIYEQYSEALELEQSRPRPRQTNQQLQYQQHQQHQQQQQQQQQPEQPTLASLFPDVGTFQEAPAQTDGGMPIPGQEYNNRLGFSEELFTDWNAWFDDADDFMNLLRAPTWNPM